jgi:MFS family permease
MGDRSSFLRSRLERSSQPVLTLYAVTAAFTAYFCMYAFRKPFSAAEYSGHQLWGLDLKAALVISQIIGYTLSKYIGIKICSEATPARRATLLVALIIAAEAALVLFGLVPWQWRFAMMFLNGLPLGMVWGLVVSYLEGRRTSELLLAGLSCSFIVSSGAVKTIGSGLLKYNVPEAWMPAATGAIFLLPFFLSVWMLKQVPQPSQADIDARVEREPMNHANRLAFVKHFLPGLVLLFTFYFFLTAYRDLRDNYAAEIFIQLGYSEKPAIFVLTELPAALGVMVALAALNLIEDNRWGLLGAFGIMITGCLLLGGATLLYDRAVINGVTWMILVGLGAYLTYVPFGSVLFDRLIAATHVAGTAVFAIYVADALGYTGSIGVLLYKNYSQRAIPWFDFMRGFSYIMCLLGCVCLGSSAIYFWFRHGTPQECEAG